MTGRPRPGRRSPPRTGPPRCQVPATRALPRATATVQDTINPHGLPITPWAGLGVPTAWAAAGLLTGGLLLRLRDA
jgi:hypothetical protein